MGVVLGSKLGLIGWGMLLFSLPFLVIFVLNSELISAMVFTGDMAETRGVVTGIERTSASEDEVPILEHRFRYSVGDNEYQGRSYAPGQRASVGTLVPVEFLQEEPETSRIVGLRARTFSEWTGFVLILPLVGLILLIVGLRRGLHRLWLLKNGQVAHAKLISRRPTGSEVNGRTVYELIFELQLTPDQLSSCSMPNRWERWSRKHRFKHKTHTPETVTDDDMEEVLYSPRHPGRAFPLDALPSGVRSTSAGITAPWWAMLPLALPCLVLVAFIILSVV